MSHTIKLSDDPVSGSVVSMHRFVGKRSRSINFGQFVEYNGGLFRRKFPVHDRKIVSVGGRVYMSLNFKFVDMSIPETHPARVFWQTYLIPVGVDGDIVGYTGTPSVNSMGMGGFTDVYKVGEIWWVYDPDDGPQSAFRVRIELSAKDRVIVSAIDEEDESESSPISRLISIPDSGYLFHGKDTSSSERFEDIRPILDTADRPLGVAVVATRRGTSDINLDIAVTGLLLDGRRISFMEGTIPSVSIGCATYQLSTVPFSERRKYVVLQEKLTNHRNSKLHVE